MHQTRRLAQRLTTALQTKKTGWGPYRQHQRSEHFVGTEPSVLKYHVVRLFIKI